tara:strand:- start:472 stop:642 length:171 start_codon:yes stop_codon:yes gene_type:complete
VIRAGESFGSVIAQITGRFISPSGFESTGPAMHERRERKSMWVMWLEERLLRMLKN